MSTLNAGTPQPGEQMDESQLQAKLERAASTYFEKFSTPAFRMQELIGHHKNHWLLSDDFKMAYDQPVGLIKGEQMVLRLLNPFLIQEIGLLLLVYSTLVLFIPHLNLGYFPF